MPTLSKALTFVQEVSTEMGRVQDLVGCPFCEAEVYTYRWSRFGGGKRCGCGALLCGYTALKETP